MISRTIPVVPLGVRTRLSRQMALRNITFHCFATE